MKRVRIRWAALAVAGWMAACGVEGGRVFLSLGTGGTGGIYYPLGGALASRLSIADEGRQYTAEVSGGSVENINRLRYTVGICKEKPLISFNRIVPISSVH